MGPPETGACMDKVSGTTLDKNISCQHRDTGIRNIGKEYEDVFKNNKPETIELEEVPVNNEITHV